MAATEPESSERVREILASLERECAELRRRRADRAAQEANRLAIAYWRSRLSLAAKDERAGL